jgi:hypothetical protein
MLGAFMIARAVGVLGFGFVGDGLLLAGIRRRGAGAGLLTWHGRKDLGRIWIALMAGVHFLPLVSMARTKSCPVVFEPPGARTPEFRAGGQVIS